MKNWKTTLASIIAAIGVGFSNSDDPTLRTIGEIITIIGMVFFGFSSKDNNVTGGTVMQPTPSVVLKQQAQERRVM